MRGSNKYGLIAGMVVLCLNLFSCKFSGKKEAELMGKWDKTESAGVGATLAERCEFFEDQKFVWTIKDLSNPNISTLVTGTYKIEKDSFFLYDEKKAERRMEPIKNYISFR